MLRKKIHKKKTESLQLNIEALHSDHKRICYFNSNSKFNQASNAKHPELLAIGSLQEVSTFNSSDAFQKLNEFLKDINDWTFGYMSYELKDSIENLSSKNLDHLCFPLITFFIPEVVIEILSAEDIIHFHPDITSYDKVEQIYKTLYSLESIEDKPSPVNVSNRISKEDYLQSFKKIKQHILRGDIYEINFCQEFYSNDARIEPYKVYQKYNASSGAPFSAYCRFGDHYIISSSPERFIKKEGNKLISQPIKGTIRRSAEPSEDNLLRDKLHNDPKERNENVMIVDLVRNDLSKIASKASVKVDELFGVYSFKQVHQMISTISSDLKEGITFTEIIKATFPMGSMTGAPKVRAMQIIEECESTRRGVYSGALGYIDPEGDFDFSVVIRTILYNASNHYLSFMTGSAITAQAKAESEYAECLLKAKAMFEAIE